MNLKLLGALTGLALAFATAGIEPVVTDHEASAETTSFLEALLRHLTRAERALDSRLGRLPPETTDRLLRRLGPRWTEED